MALLNINSLFVDPQRSSIASSLLFSLLLYFSFFLPKWISSPFSFLLFLSFSIYLILFYLTPFGFLCYYGSNVNSIQLLCNGFSLIHFLLWECLTCFILVCKQHGYPILLLFACSYSYFTAQQICHNEMYRNICTLLRGSNYGNLKKRPFSPLVRLSLQLNCTWQRMGRIWVNIAMSGHEYIHIYIFILVAKVGPLVALVSSYNEALCLTFWLHLFSLSLYQTLTFLFESTWLRILFFF